MRLLKNNVIRTTFIILIIIIVCILLWARYISTKGLIVKEVAIRNDNLKDEYKGLKIVQFSDLHYGSTIRLKELKNIVNTINKQNPDIIVFTGDLVENKVILDDKEIKNITKTLSELKPNIETLAVKGNHDYDHDYFDIITKDLDWIILNNNYEYFYKDSSVPIVFVGFDDELNGKPDYANGFSFLKETEEDLFTIVLLHEPDAITNIKDYKYDLAMAGHSHLGQVRLPFIGALYTPKGAKKYYDEHYVINDKDLYISGGIGTSLIKFRFFNKPSITLYRFY